MYEQKSHALLNKILIELKQDFNDTESQPFLTRLGANFYSVYQLFISFYGHRPDFEKQLKQLVSVMAQNHYERSKSLRKSDLKREQDPDWFLSQQWVGMALYTDGFAEDLKGLNKRVDYFEELGVNLVHLMPMMKCPEDASDGGYAVSDFCEIDKRFGTIKDLQAVAKKLHKNGSLLTMDVVLNHTSDEHEWARKAQQGEEKYQDYYYVYNDRDIPDQFEESLLEIFPENAPGNFTWDESMGKWVMTVFNNYQWDLNYTNPAVFIEMVNVILFWANKGADILRLDAVAFLWKKIGSVSQNLEEAHQILQLLKDCCQITAPGVLFIAEAIVAPNEIIRYFGGDSVAEKECDIAYNATFMALLWDAVATKNTRLLNQSLKSLPAKPDQTTWLNYVRCHDDIGLGYDDKDITAVGYEPKAHREFLIDYYMGKFVGSTARGLPFGYNEKTGDTRISGSLASLIGLEAALLAEDKEAIDNAIKKTLLLYAMILSYGGIPLLYYGDELGTINDSSYLQDPVKAEDNRWVHRPSIDWENAEQRYVSGTVENRLFNAIKKMISVRKATQAFADFNNRDVLNVSNPNLFLFTRYEYQTPEVSILVVANFDDSPHHLYYEEINNQIYFDFANNKDLITQEKPEMHETYMVIPANGFYWLEQ
ncbi:amylosucrase [uncultured Cocleimonas sp.]|uniref:amylosucrase n=1 Tax=uncultured Cocleimonas sp. TaxID=1051587 RepID=UPI00261606EB|nr:amylosucrase [uncultured Cocleimonas sp.]